MAYLDTNKAVGTAEITSGFYRLVKSVVMRLTRRMDTPSKSPKEILAAQHRAEAHRCAVDNLLR